MEKLILLWRSVIVLVVSIATCTPIFGSPCAVLEYEEMKDMSAEELTKEYCAAIRTADKNVSSAFAMLLGTSSDEAAVQLLSSQADECKNQASRIARVLRKKGIDHPDEKLHQALCQATQS